MVFTLFNEDEKIDGFTTAGNASQVSDGAAAVLLMRRSKAKELGLPIIGKFVAFAVAGVAPNIMGVGKYIMKVIDIKVLLTRFRKFWQELVYIKIKLTFTV
jgi:acetyl-CoA acetyltransferase